MADVKVEIERRFLLKSFPNELRFDKSYYIEQFYIKQSEGVLRYRKSFQTNLNITESKEGVYEKITKKRIENGINHEIDVVKITSQDYDYAYPTRERIISKTRYCFIHEGLTFEIDRFMQLHLFICEVELTSLEQEIKFPKEISDRIIIEITDFPEFSNYNLAL